MSTFGSTNPVKSENVLLLVQTISSKDGTLNCLFDNAATCSLITEAAAKRLNLVGEPMKLDITTVTGTTSVNSAVYHVPLIDNNNTTHLVKALRVECISDKLEKVDVSGLKHIFSASIQDQWSHAASRPLGATDLLLGVDYLSLHPVDCERQGNIRIHSSIFGNGLILGGSHPCIKSKALKFSNEVSSITHHANASVNRVSIQPIYEYFEADNMGIVPPKRCGNCRNCMDCSFRGHMLSLKEQY